MFCAAYCSEHCAERFWRLTIGLTTMNGCWLLWQRVTLQTDASSKEHLLRMYFFKSSMSSSAVGFKNLRYFCTSFRETISRSLVFVNLSQMKQPWGKSSPVSEQILKLCEKHSSGFALIEADSNYKSNQKFGRFVWLVAVALAFVAKEYVIRWLIVI